MRQTGELLALACVMAFVVLLCGCGSDGNEVSSVRTAVKPVRPPPDDPSFVPALTCRIVDKGLAVVPADGSTSRLLYRFADEIVSTWKPDGSRLAFLASANMIGTLRTISPDGSGLQEYGGISPAPEMASLDWFPEMDCLIYKPFMDSPDDPLPPAEMGVWAYPLGGQAYHLGMTFPVGEEAAARWMAYCSVSPDMEAEPGYQGMVAVVTSTQLYPDETASALYLQKVACSPGGRPLAVDGPATRVELSERVSAPPTFSPDGARLAVRAQGSDSPFFILLGLNYATWSFSEEGYLYPGNPAGVSVEPLGIRASILWSTRTDGRVVFTLASGPKPGGAWLGDVYQMLPDGTALGWLTSPGDKASVNAQDWNPAWVEGP